MVSEKGASGARAVMAAGPLKMGADAVAVTAEVARSSDLRRWLWARRMFVIELIL